MKLKLLLFCIIILTCSTVQSQLNISDEFTYGAQNEIEIGVALRRHIGKDRFDSIFSIPINIKGNHTGSQRLYVFSLDLTSTGELKNTKIFHSLKSDAIYNVKFPDIDAITFNEFLTINKFCFTSPFDYRKYNDSEITRLLSYDFMPTRSVNAFFPYILQREISLRDIFGINGTIADLFQRNTIFLQFVLSNNLAPKTNSEYLEAIEDSKIYNSMLIYAALTKCYGSFIMQSWNGAYNYREQHQKPIFMYDKCMDLKLRVIVDKEGKPKDVKFLNTPPFYSERIHTPSFNHSYNERKILSCLINHEVEFKSERLNGFSEDENNIEINFPGIFSNFKEKYYGAEKTYYTMFIDICKNLYIILSKE